MAHGDGMEGKWRRNFRMEWVASTLHTTSEHAVSSITTADTHTSAASSRLNWRPRRFKWTRPFRGKTKSGFCACAITFQTQSKASSPEEPLHPPYILSNHSGSVHHKTLPESETLTNLLMSGTEDRLLADSKPDVHFAKPLGCFQAGFKQEVCTWKKSLHSET